ncbi:hypothetical protein VF21_00560 [Pseudogymnoascus sp. 05NY08]|nr:hypothetical protein VF21_00560 [Pseudogymnoascus sp. 05NY08]
MSVGDENEWFERLKYVLGGFENIFIVFDSSVLRYGHLHGGDVWYPWITKLLEICDNHYWRFSEDGYIPKVGVKVALAICGREPRLELPGPLWKDCWSHVDIAREEERFEQRIVHREGNWLLAEVIEAYNDIITRRPSRESTEQPSPPPYWNMGAESVRLFPGASFDPPAMTNAPSPQPRAVNVPFLGAVSSFETTVIAEQQNNLDRTKQEEQFNMERQEQMDQDHRGQLLRMESRREKDQYLRNQQSRKDKTRQDLREQQFRPDREEDREQYRRAHDREDFAQQPLDMARLRIMGDPPSTLRHHSSAYSLQTQPSSNSIRSPSSTQPGPSTTSSNLSPYRFRPDNHGRLSLQDFRQSSDVRPIAKQVSGSQFPTRFSRQSQDQPAGSQQTSSTTKLKSHKANVSVSNFELFDDQKVLEDAAGKAAKAKTWFKYLDELHEAMPRNIDKENRIKIAVLDTGIYMQDSTISQRKNSSRITYQSFVTGDPNPTEPSDDNGHGTHIAGLLLRVAPNARIYVAKISDKDKLDEHYDPEQIANAIRHAVDKWRVHIISMSFGFDGLTDELGCIDEAISHTHKKAVLFAAARNSGVLKRIAYPAILDDVICIYSTDGLGKPSDFNPPSKQHNNFGTIGESLLSSWPRSEPRYMSGTSFATPIAAGIAAVTMDYLEQNKRGRTKGDQYLAERIKTRTGIVAVFTKHLSAVSGDVRVLCPWEFFQKGATWSEGALLATLQACF